MKTKAENDIAGRVRMNATVTKETQEKLLEMAGGTKGMADCLETIIADVYRYYKVTNQRPVRGVGGSDLAALAIALEQLKDKATEANNWVWKIIGDPS